MKMQNVTVRFSLMSALCLFSFMIVFGAVVGVLALGRANESTLLSHDISARALIINDAYKESTRTRAALARAYGALVEKNAAGVKDAALSSAQGSAERTAKLLEAFAKAPAFRGQDDALKADLISAGQALSAALQRAAEALRTDDASGYARINDEQVTASGAAFSAQLEKFQKLTLDLSNGIVAQLEREYHMVVWLVAVGMTLALALVVGVHFLLRRIVIAPLNRAVSLLDQVADGNLTTVVKVNSSNEIGRLFAAIHSMQQGLLNTVSRVRSSSDIINASAQHIAAGNADLSARTDMQASSLEETAASMEQLTGTVKQNADNALQANQLALSASETAVKGGAVVAQVVDTMSAINDSSRRIVDIISVIDSIAFQTNILALNAAVEAARAGEQGRGFAVVATEVRSLAQRSAAAAKEIKGLINDSVEKVGSGSRLVEHAGVTMNEVVDSVRRVTAIVGAIAEASREQSDGIGQVNVAIGQMDEVTQKNAVLVQEAAAAAQSLQTQASMLAQVVGVFAIDPAALPSAVIPALPAAQVATPAPTHAIAAPVRIAPPAAARPRINDDDWDEF